MKKGKVLTNDARLRRTGLRSIAWNKTNLFVMEKSKRVNPNWMNDTYLKAISVSSKMFKWNIVYFFERLNEFLDEFDKIEGFMANDNLYKKVTEQPHFWNQLFKGILETRLFGPKKYVALYFDNYMLMSSTDVRTPMAEKYFFALWYMITVKPNTLPKGIQIKEDTSYFMSFHMDEEVIIVSIQHRDGEWLCYAYRDNPRIFRAGTGEFLHLVEKA